MSTAPSPEATPPAPRRPRAQASSSSCFPRRERPLVLHANSSKAQIFGRLAGPHQRVAGAAVHRPRLGLQGARRPRVDGVPVGRPRDEPADHDDHLRRPRRTRRGAGARTCRPARTVVIHNGVPLDRPRPSPGPASRPATMSVGRLRAPKDFVTLVRAMAALEPGSAGLRIAGDGPSGPLWPPRWAGSGSTRASSCWARAPTSPSCSPARTSSCSPATPRAYRCPCSRRWPPDCRSSPPRWGSPGARPRWRDRRPRASPRQRRARPRTCPIVGDPELRDRLGDAGRRRVEREFSLARFEREHLELYRNRARR